MKVGVFIIVYCYIVYLLLFGKITCAEICTQFISGCYGNTHSKQISFCLHSNTLVLLELPYQVLLFVFVHAVKNCCESFLR